jgi:fatty acid desaturase
MDTKGFCRELEELQSRTYASLSEKDFKHLLKIEWWGRGCSFLGYSTIWIIPNPFTAFLISMGHFTRWLLAHHILHRGYDKVPGVPLRYTSKGFGKGKRRFIDWFDWLVPEAWDYEHNILHHYNTGEDHDPDVAERHTELLRKLPVPNFIKYFLLFLVACTWKFTYYAPNTASVLNPDNAMRVKKEHIAYLTIKNIFNVKRKEVRRLWREFYLPYGLVHFVLLPLMFFPLGKTTVIFVLINKILAEIFTNLHSFLVIGPNHTGDDLARYDFHYASKEEYFAVQVLGSANYHCGKELTDFLSIWLNYQIEHHLFPDLPMRQYSIIQPEVKALCKKYGLPYRQESIWRRFARMVNVCVGKKSMHVVSSMEALHVMSNSPPITGYILLRRSIS